MVGILAIAVAACDSSSSNDPDAGDAGLADTAVPDGDATVEAGLDADAATDAPPSDGAVDGASDGGTNAKCVACPSGQKLCGTGCVAIDDPRYGCDPVLCTSCPQPDARGSFTCNAGACKAVCNAGFADCDGVAANNCESALDSPASCGACNVKCTGNDLCGPNGCTAACSPPTTQCGVAPAGRCKNLATSTTSCGGCDTICNANDTTAVACNVGTCALTCKQGFSVCSGTCTDTTHDPQHCGGGCSACPGKLRGQSPTCTNGTCGVACNPGFQFCSTACVEILADDSNCGSCGNACGAQNTCVDGKCVASTSLRVITGLSQPEDILVDANNIYWTDVGDGTVWQADKVTFAKTPIASNQAKPWRLASDGTSLYWTNNLGATIASAPIGGGATTVLYAANQPLGIHVDATSLYWSEGSTPRTMKAPKTPGTATTLLDAYAADQLLGDATYLYGAGYRFKNIVGNQRATFRIAKVGGAADAYTAETQPLAAAPDSEQIALRAPFLYLGSLYAGATTSVRPAQRYADPAKPGLNVMALEDFGVPTGPPPHAIVADDCNLYFTSKSNSTFLGIWRAQGGSKSWYRVTGAVTAPNRIAMDDKWIYWTDAGFIGRAPK